MAIRMSIEQHHVAFPTKVLSDKVGRVLNMVIKKDTDKELYEKGWGYLHSHEYKHLCQGIKCLRLIEKYYPNSEYIFKFYKRIQDCNKYLSKIA